MGHRTKTQCGRDVVRRKWPALPFGEGIIACELWAQTLQDLGGDGCCPCDLPAERVTFLTAGGWGVTDTQSLL